jgi:hypothetical protein
MKDNKIQIVSAVVDNINAVFYTVDGNTITLKQNDKRLKSILDVVVPITLKGGIAEIDLTDFSVYAKYSETTGNTSFFKVLKKYVKGFFGIDNTKEVQYFIVPQSVKDELRNAVSPQQISEETVIEHGTKLTNLEDTIDATETIVAVVTDKSTNKKTVIAGMESLKPLITHAIVHNNNENMQAFINKCAEISKIRLHSVDDLLRFLSKGDLPITNDGCFIAYKMLSTSPEENVFVDLHTRRVKQKVGSIVEIPEKLVNSNRNVSCASGLHIARRDYLAGFGGNVCVLCKIDPMDVITVPHEDASKIRVMRYFIIDKFDGEEMQLLKSNLPLKEQESIKKIYNAIIGNIIKPIEIVTINGGMGNDIVVKKISDDIEPIKEIEITGADLISAAPINTTVEETPSKTVDIKTLNKQIKEKTVPTVEPKKKKEPFKKATKATQKAPVKEKPNPMKDMLAKFDALQEGSEKTAFAIEMLSFLKAKKKTWKFYGIESDTVKYIINVSKMTFEEKKLSHKENARKHYKLKDYNTVKEIKKTSKLSWSKLGFSDKEISIINKIK